MKNVTVVLFDIDSTLIDAGVGAGSAFNKAFFELYGMQPATISKHGKTDLAISREIAIATFGKELTKIEDNELNRRYALYLQESIKGRTEVLPSVKETLEVLYSLREFVMVGLETGNLEECAIIKLKEVGLQKYFNFGGFGSDHIDRK